METGRGYPGSSFVLKSLVSLEVFGRKSEYSPEVGARGPRTAGLSGTLPERWIARRQGIVVGKVAGG